MVSKSHLDAKSPTRNGRSPGPKGRKSGQESSSYASDGVKDINIFNLPSSDYQVLFSLIILAAIVRLFRISQPSSVVFDEVHFGGFATKYIKGKFFMDVHPPLAKLLITLAGWLAGFDGNFDFKEIGKDYLEPGVPYVAMRMVPAVMGILTIPSMFLTLRAAGCRTSTAVTGALLVIFENGLITQSRLILLDSPLVIFTALTALTWTCFTNQHEQGPEKAFGPAWWFWLAATGISLGATVSVKWVGLFTIAWVGSLTILQLWVLLGDPKTVTPRLWFKHFLARAFCLIVLPLAFYMSMFAIHFLCLVNPGDGDGFMSSEFQATLNSKAMKDVPADIAFGSRVSIRHHNTQGGYLHSHNHMYPGGSKQQQITLYPHKDENNVWIFENQTQPLGEYGEVQGPLAWDNVTDPFIKDGDTIKLYHVLTNRRVHSHDIRPPVTEADWQNEVSAYGYEGFPGDANDLFRVEIVPSMSDGDVAKERLRTIQTKFKLVHIMTGCTLFSHKVKLPDWAYEQQEVTCAKSGTLPNSIWYVESNSHPMMKEDAEKVNYKKPGFFSKFFELQRVMWTTNAGLVDSHTWDSRPPSWPTLLRGINFWGRNHRQVYLLGNPVIWWSSTAAIALYVIFKGLAVLRWQRGFADYGSVTFKRFDYEIGQTVLGWCFHYFPFYLMARQLFLHHYFPALYFAIIAMCQIFDFVTSRIEPLGLKSKPFIGKVLMVLFVGLSIFSFMQFSPLVYGEPWTQQACKKVKLLKSWDFDCKAFHKDLSQYSSPVDVAGSQTTSIAAATTQSEQDGQEAVAQESVTPQPEDPLILGAEERVEYRDQEGNVLDKDEVEALEREGKVKFSTSYEVRTRTVDSNGQEVNDNAYAPPHPDVEGQDPQTPENPDTQEGNEPASVEGEEKSVEQEDQGQAKPASDGNEATDNDSA